MAHETRTATRSRMLSMPSVCHVCMAGDSMVVFNIAPSEAIAGCAKGEAMANTLTARKLKDIALFTAMMRTGSTSSCSIIHAHQLHVYFCDGLLQIRLILSAT